MIIVLGTSNSHGVGRPKYCFSVHLNTVVFFLYFSVYLIQHLFFPIECNQSILRREEFLLSHTLIFTNMYF